MATSYDWLLFKPAEGGEASVERVVPLKREAVERALLALPGVKKVGPNAYRYCAGKTAVLISTTCEEECRSLLVQVPYDNPLCSFDRAVKLCRQLAQVLGTAILDLQVGLWQTSRDVSRGRQEFRRQRELARGIVRAIRAGRADLAGLKKETLPYSP
ncbi:MAG: hypothetical protein QJR13_09740 [Bacillota bacterium]|nr:hypothetical protein [Bacillota bacterium]